MLRRLCCLIVLAGVFGTTPLWAAQLSRPQVEYSADSVIQSEEGTIEQHIYVTPAKERKEMLTGEGDGAIHIFRFDNKVMWMRIICHTTGGRPRNREARAIAG